MKIERLSYNDGVMRHSFISNCLSQGIPHDCTKAKLTLESLVRDKSKVTSDPHISFASTREVLSVWNGSS